MNASIHSLIVGMTAIVPESATLTLAQPVLLAGLLS